MNAYITKASEEDIPQMAYALFHSKLGKRYYPTLEVLTNQMQNSFITDAFYILKVDAELAGFIWFQANGAFHTYTYLHMIFVIDKFQNHGYGKLLMEFLENFSLNDTGMKKLKTKIFLVVGTWNDSAIRFYEHYGYLTLSTIPGLFRKHTDENLMMKECTQASIH